MTTSSSMILARAAASGQKTLLENEAEKLARIYGIPVVRSKLVRSENEAVLASKSLGYPVALKIVSPDVVHKTDIGGVILNISSADQVRSHYRKMLRNIVHSNKKAKIMGVLVQKMARSGHEFVVGATRDLQFGPTVMFGLGGIYVEMFKDVSFKFAPLNESESLRMIRELRSFVLFQGYRGSKPLDIQSASRVIIAVGAMITDNDLVESIDVNPLIVYRRGAIAADVRVILR